VTSRSAEEQLPAGVAVAGVLVYCLVAVGSALIEVLLIPLYVGGTIFPITVLIAVVVNWMLPVLVHTMAAWRWVIGLPLLSWLAGVIVLGFTNTARGSVLVPGYGDGQYVGLGLFFIGTLAGAVSVVRVLTPKIVRPAPTDEAGPIGPTDSGPDVTAAAARR